VVNRLVSRLSRQNRSEDTPRTGFGASITLISIGLILVLCSTVVVLFAQGHSARSIMATTATEGEDESEVAALPGGAPRPDDEAAALPNIIVVYVDDMRASDLDVMHTVKNEIAARGASFSNSFVTTSSCCPARATHLTGQYAHNTGVLHNRPPHGGYGALKFGKQAAGETLPIWLEQAGYRNVFLGKIANNYPHSSDINDVPPGFSDWYGLYEQPVRGQEYTIYRQTRYALRVKTRDNGPSLLDQGLATDVLPLGVNGQDGQIYVYEGRDVHQTEILMDAAVEAVERDDGSQPLYLNVWLTAPHSGGDGPIIGGKHYETTLRSHTVRPAPPELARLESLLRRGDDLGDLGLDRSGAFNEQNVEDKPPFISEHRRLSRQDIADIEIRNALRLASLQSVDRKVAELLAAIERMEERTGRASFIVFSSDNGYFLGEHRLPYEKNWHYGPSADVPLIVRGPGVSENARIDAPVANIDLAPTLLDIAGGAKPSGPIDGRSLLPLLAGRAYDGEWWEHRALLLEGFWGGRTDRRYAGVRTKTHLYVEHYGRTAPTAVEFRELYDLQRDPDYQYNLLHGKVSSGSETIAWRLATLLDRLRTCSGALCHERDREMFVDPDQNGSAAPSEPAGGLGWVP
jgi:arylsulfatase A-like enzyme